MDKLTGDTAMTPEQLAAIAARNEARTQGKWTHTTYLSGTQNVEFPGSRGVAVVNSVNDHDNKPIANSVLCLPPTHMAVSQRLEDYGRDDDHQRFHNGQFIAHASEDIPSLLAEVARLTAALTEAEKRHVDLHRLAYSWMVAHDKLKAGKPYAFPSPLEPDAITKLETTAYQHGYDAAKEQAMQAVEDAGWYRSSDDAVSWDAQDEQVQYSIAAIAAMVKP